MQPFTNTFLFLQQEGYLIQSALMTGLHNLRHASVDNKGSIYTAFFQLSIGLERMMKAIFIINFMRENKLVTPTNAQLRQYGHKLTVLFDHLAMLSLPGHANPLAAIPSNSTERMILEALSEFADGARYHNLNALASSHTTRDPLELWNAVIERVLAEDVRSRDQARVTTESHLLASIMSGATIVIAADLVKHPMDVHSALMLPRLHDLAARHIVSRTMTVIKALARQIRDVSRAVIDDPKADRSQPLPVPYMQEFFDFVHLDRRRILSKRRWP